MTRGRPGSPGRRGQVPPYVEVASRRGSRHMCGDSCSLERSDLENCLESQEPTAETEAEEAARAW